MTQGSYGFNVQIQTGMDLSTANVIIVRVQRPDGTVFDRSYTGSVVSPGTNGSMVTYTVESGDLTIPGWYHIQILDQTSGRDVISEIGLFRVHAALPGPH
jgi:hypothetical protein